MKKILFALCLFLALCEPCVATESRHDTRPLTEKEIETFMPLICVDPIASEPDGDYGTLEIDCEDIIGNPEVDQAREQSGEPQDATLIPLSIFYGDLTGQNADEAYITVDASFETAGREYGDGILFRRESGKWKLVSWYPRGQMHDCVALPGGERQSMLCADNFGHNGKVFSTVSILRVPLTVFVLNKGPMGAENVKTILDLTDDRMWASSVESEGGVTSAICETYKSGGLFGPVKRSLLFSVQKIKRSSREGVFAEADIVYATPEDIARECAKPTEERDLRQIEESIGTAEFAIKDGEVVFIPPLPMSGMSLTGKISEIEE
ncbi:MAG: hypothetical protein PHE27_05255 [Alphaproteobacteria bacterium]|nr:hypothetical protein [Alphaproteobacteria bacterium]